MKYIGFSSPEYSFPNKGRSEEKISTSTVGYHDVNIKKILKKEPAWKFNKAKKY